MPDLERHSVAVVPLSDGQVELDGLRVLSPPGYFVHPMLRPDGRAVAFFGKPREEDSIEIWSCNIDGSDLRQLTHHGDVAGHPFWSADGRRIVYMRTANHDVRDWSMRQQFRLDRPSAHLWIMDGDGGSPTQLTDGDATDDRPCVSPDGQCVVFVSTRSGANNLWKLDLASGAIAQVTAHAGLDYRPIFSPDGRRLAYFSDHHADGHHDLCVMDWPGGAIERPLPRGEFEWVHGPYWLDGGRSILFHARSCRDGRVTLWTVELDSGRLAPLELPGLTNYAHGSLTPDGRMLLFDTGEAL